MKNRRDRKKHTFRIGFHTSIANGISQSIERALSLRCSTMQIFSHNPRQWRQTSIPDEEVQRFKTLRKIHDINPVFIHASYLINLASLSSETLQKSIELLSYELRTADTLGAEYVVLHTGSSGGAPGYKARRRAARAIAKVMRVAPSGVLLLLENTAGERHDITSSVKTLAEVVDMSNVSGIGGICIDTCHAFSSGYDLRTSGGVEDLLTEVERCIGLDRLRLIHLNDSKRPLGSGIDRHEHIGRGCIGMSGFRSLLADRRILNIPMIMETPKASDRDDRRNLKRLLSILSES